jgi:hypothetical protein
MSLSPPVYTVPVPNPAAGADWSYTLPAPARLVGITTGLTCSSTAANRFPLLAINNGSQDLFNTSPPAALTANTNWLVDAAVGVNDSPILLSSGGYVGSFERLSLPSWLLPAGYKVHSKTINLQPTDQWNGTLLTFSAE